MPETAIKMTRASEKSAKGSKSVTREYTEAIFVALIAALILRTFVVQAFRIPTGSMKDTLLIGDFLLVNKFVYGARTPDGVPFLDVSIPFVRLPAVKEPKQGEIVVFKYPKDEKLDYIKRCIAKGGQTVEIKDGDVYIDDQLEGEKTFLKKSTILKKGIMCSIIKSIRLADKRIRFVTMPIIIWRARTSGQSQFPKTTTL